MRKRHASQYANFGSLHLCNFRLWKHSGNRLNVIIQHYKFNTFIAMFLIISEIYLFLFRTHVKVGSGILIGCDFLYNMSSLFFI